MDILDIREEIILRSHPYNIRNIGLVDKTYLGIVTNKSFLCQLAHKWCFPDKTIDEISNLPEFTFRDVVGISMFTFPIKESIGIVHPISLYSQAAIRGYTETECMMFIDYIFKNPISNRITKSVEEVIAVTLIAIKHNHRNIMISLMHSLLYDEEDEDDAFKSINLQLYDLTSILARIINVFAKHYHENEMDDMLSYSDYAGKNNYIINVYKCIANQLMQCQVDIEIILTILISILSSDQLTHKYDKFIDMLSRKNQNSIRNPILRVALLTSHYVPDHIITKKIENMKLNPITMYEKERSYKPTIEPFVLPYKYPDSFCYNCTPFKEDDETINKLLSHSSSECFIAIDEYYYYLKYRQRCTGQLIFGINKFGLTSYNKFL